MATVNTIGNLGRCPCQRLANLSQREYVPSHPAGEVILYVASCFKICPHIQNLDYRATVP